MCSKGDARLTLTRLQLKRVTNPTKASAWATSLAHVLKNRGYFFLLDNSAAVDA